MTYNKSILLIGILLFGIVGCSKPADTNTVKIGTILELTGSTPAIGASSKNAAEMAVAEINARGGLTVDGKKMPVELIIEDDAAKADQAAAAAQKLISQDDVLAIVGPNSSTGAIPAAEVAENNQTLLITPWSTDPQTTLNKDGQHKKYIFRACFTDEYESKVLAHFAYDKLKYKNVAVLYDVALQAPNSQSITFKESFEKLGGKIVAFETYTTNDKDFSAQLTKIKAAHPDVIFLPAYYDNVPLVTQQAKRLGIQVPFLGSDAWSSPELIALSNGAVEGDYFANHYSPDAKTPVTREFVEKYQKQYGSVPDDIAALTYDAYQILFQAIDMAGKKDRKLVRDNMSKLPSYKGVTGTIKFPPDSGDPIKSVVIMRILGGRFVWVANAEA